ncbi:ATP-binding cassette domain-containing protein [Kibdelosporangium phytohabitans]|uniref:Sugar ABC transporter ATP-binding protein n=1 Tax=Kibdelosporangium phytohabitans TaxID=860235 RepID=A0A0N9ID58_9PSEU|nr:ATP-binding cassette domain-containing protein [Kibdelosporangium phytohabitans]ALG13242.1 sugar ABC transporter ATP-binding protein [Kibdelosporangium phytohabitans]MBE1465012.1 simple sugar transport system ATP-binding protein [Kibdelosporangium phytohabitans]
MTPVLRAQNIVKHYGSVEALRGASFEVGQGEVVSLIGDNGAGKSTLVKCLSGAEIPTSGTILLEGEPVTLDSPVAARRLGIETVYQDLAVAPDLDPAANLFLGREVFRKGLLGKLGVLDKAEMRRRAAEEFTRFGVTLQNIDVPIGSLSGGQRQSVAVARSVAWASKVVFMDEPTAALGVVQREKVLDVIRRVRDEGMAVVLISHNMPEVLSVSDRVEVLRLGKRVARFTAADASLEDLVGAMTGALVQEDAT